MKGELERKQGGDLEERLWKLLNSLEDLKREWDDEDLQLPVDRDGNAVQSAVQSQLQFQKRLAELKAALLPLVIASSSGDAAQAIDDQSDNENEIAVFNSELRLMLHATNWERMRSESNKMMLSNVVSVSGDTHVGKSTIINSLLTAQE
jgi:tRNA U34 5-carboxymethylaminomethyl modifying GTPase MnmE/TrmE